ncbi:Lead, cadmium, zinc and mercury transporting ATPase [Klebsiella pneumoniae subsp. ozaenae]|uniref:Lead, cadmium, zinc and mercury transporting ATPase n=1 Tax=Klebsiella pneumoniae subsp. ozaenae TaxID=574 RepID=A0A378AMS6_KLEPO|nr:Lead, cadmium, zinc and mercury transporting ATPase [Klebsiella pneumoniae subsp. ozaenae]
MMALSWGLEQANHPAGQLAFIATTLVGLWPVARQALRLIKSGSWFAIETLMSVAAIGALFIGATAEAAMVLLLFLIGERLEGWAASRARQGVSALMAAEARHRHPSAQRRAGNRRPARPASRRCD